jgi:hypothetical protein
VLLSWGAKQEQATRQAGIASTAKLIFLRLSGEGRRREEKGRDEKDNQSSQYGDKIRSQD